MKRGCKASEVIQKIVDASADAKARLGLEVSKALLQIAEESLRSWQANCHGAKLT
jgi:hypothetical protein